MVLTVIWLRTFVVLALLAFWMPATSHAFLENTGFIHEHAHDSADHHDHESGQAAGHDAADGNCRVESGIAKAPLPFTILAFLLPEHFSQIREWSLEAQPEPTGPSPPGTALPQPSRPRAPPLI
jgi:hypothetical protein